MSSGYYEIFREALSSPEKFWGRIADSVHWFKPYDNVLNRDNPPFYSWFEGGMVNSCYSALDYQVDHGRKDQVALIYDSPVTKTVKKFTYGELRDLVAKCAGGLSRLGVVKGDRVVIYMPMIPEAVIAMLACARIGAIHSVVFGGFAPRELATRIDDAEPKVVLSASCGIEVSRIIPYKPLLDTAIGMCTYRPSACVIVQRPEHPAEMQGSDMDWDMLMDSSPVPCVPVAATDPLYLLYTSGTTGKPKGSCGIMAAIWWR